MKDAIAAGTDNSAPRWEIPHLPKVKAPRFDLHVHTTPERNAIENYIQTRFWQVHRAQVNHFLPGIISLSCSDSYSAAVGLAPAANNRLFAESYLAEPIELAIANKIGISIARSDVVEIGNLVSTWKGSSLLMFIFIGELLARLGYRWILFTATREVQTLLARLHYVPVVLADANPQALPDGGSSWGRYYDNQPRVMFGEIQPAVAAARANPMYRAAVSTINRQINRICDEYRDSPHLSAHNLATKLGENDE